jgi:glycosyltransferase involved in cell wall biosynthesis
MSPIRIAHVTYDYYPFDTLVRRLAKAAIDGGYLVDVICVRQTHEKKYEVCDGVSVYRVPMDRVFGGSLLVTLLSWYWFLLQASAVVTWLHLKRRYDVVQVHNMPDFLVFSALFPKLLGVKVILEVQDVAPELMEVKANGRQRRILKRLAIWQERISTAFAHHVITVGWPFEQLLLQRGVQAEKMTTILNSADPKLFPAARRSTLVTATADATRPFTVMYHGTVAERNGLDIAIRACAQARRVIPHVRLDIKGLGEHVPILKQLAVELGVSEHVVFSEPCPAEELVDFIVHGDVGIIPYPCDGFMELVLPTKAYEFAWMHRPMIASDTAAMRSMFRPESIVLCDPSQPESFAAAIIDLYQHPEKRARMVANAAADYMPYEWEIMAKRYQQLLLNLCGRNQEEQEAEQMSSQTHERRAVQLPGQKR